MSPGPRPKAVLILQHIDYGNAAILERSLKSQGIPTFVRHLYEGDALPPVDDRLGGVIAMGGPMSANDVAEHPWIELECAFLKSCVDAGLPVIGICLGAQLICRALGGRVERNPTAEVGWYPV